MQSATNHRHLRDERGRDRKRGIRAVQGGARNTYNTNAARSDNEKLQKENIDSQNKS